MATQTRAVSEEMVRIEAGDGFSFDAFHAKPADGDAIGGLVILQEIFGLTDQLKSVARAYAAEGFDVVLPSLFDRVAPNVVVPFSEGDRGREIMMQVPKDKIIGDIGAAAKSVSAKGGGASVLGFCWGGGLALRAAGALNLRAAVAFYGTRLGDLLSVPPKCPMLFHFGRTDSHSPPEVIDAVRGAIPDAECYIYEAGHAFANDARDSYVKDAAELAHERTKAFLARHHAG